MAKNWKEFIDQPTAKSASKANKTSPKEGFINQQKITEHKDIATLADTNDSIKELLQERETLKQQMQEMTGQETKDKKNARIYDGNIPTFKERKAKDKAWLKKKERSFEKKQRKDLDLKNWEKQQEKLKTKALEKVKKNSVSTFVHRSKKKVDKSLKLLEEKEDLFSNKVEQIKKVGTNVQNKQKHWTKKKDELLEKGKTSRQKIDEVYEQLDSKRATIKKITGFDIAENLPFEKLKKTEDLSNSLEKLDAVLKTDKMKERWDKLREKPKEVLSTKKRLEKKLTVTFQVDNIKKVVKRKEQLKTVAQNGLNVEKGNKDKTTAKKGKRFSLSDLDKQLSKYELLKQKKQELLNKQKQEQKKWEDKRAKKRAERKEKRQERRAERRKKKEDKFHLKI